MPVQPYKRKQIQKLKERAAELYRQGLTTREIGRLLNRSHSWVASVVKQIGKYLND